VGGLTCQELVELVTEYFEGTLSPAERARFDAHVADCPGCENHLEQMRMTIAFARAGAQLGEWRPDVAALLDAFRDWKHARSHDREASAAGRRTREQDRERAAPDDGG
jgi:anti-sigma factor RsiW